MLQATKAETTALAPDHLEPRRTNVQLDRAPTPAAPDWAAIGAWLASLDQLRVVSGTEHAVLVSNVGRVSAVERLGVLSLSAPGFVVAMRPAVTWAARIERMRSPGLGHALVIDRGHPDARLRFERDAPLTAAQLADITAAAAPRARNGNPVPFPARNPAVPGAGTRRVRTLPIRIVDSLFKSVAAPLSVSVASAGCDHGHVGLITRTSHAGAWFHAAGAQLSFRFRTHGHGVAMRAVGHGPDTDLSLALELHDKDGGKLLRCIPATVREPAAWRAAMAGPGGRFTKPGNAAW